MDIKDIRPVLSRMKKSFNVDTFKELADKLNVSYSTIDAWKARNKIPEKNLLKTSQICHVSLDWLKTGENQEDLSDKVRLTINNKLINFPLKAVMALIFLLEEYNNVTNKNELITKIEEFYSKSLIHVKSNISLDFTSKLDRKVLFNFIEYFLGDEDILFIFNNKNYYLDFLNFLKDSKRFL